MFLQNLRCVFSDPSAYIIVATMVKEKMCKMNNDTELVLPGLIELGCDDVSVKGHNEDLDMDLVFTDILILRSSN